MFKRSHLSTSIAVAVALAGQPLAAQEQQLVAEEVIVTGIRASLNKAIDIKRDSMQVVDSIVAEDIGKLPDNNVVESLQRVSGVQVTDRGAGEVNAVSIRGLTDVSTTINGRTIFTSSGRSVALADIPSTLVSRIDVIKNRSASQYENGIAGQIDVQTIRPFDFDGAHVTVSGRLVHQEEAEETDPIISALFSNRWETGIGEIGALINVSHATTNYRDQSITAGAQVPFMTENPTAPYTPLERIFPSRAGVAEDPIWTPGLDRGLPTEPGSTLNINGVPTEYYLSRDAVFASDLTGERERPAANISVQFAPNDSSEYIFEAFYNGYRNESFNSLHFAFVDWWGSLGGLGNLEDTFELYEGTNVIKSRTIRDGFTFGSGDYTVQKTDSYLYALGGEWDLSDNFRVKSEVVYQESDFETNFIAMRTTDVRYETSTDFSGVPSISFADNPATPDVDESDLTDPTQFAMAELYDNGASDTGSGVTFTTDAQYEFDSGIVQDIKFGLRYDDREASEYARDQMAGSCGSCQLSDYEGLVHINSDFLDGEADVPRSWAVANGPYLLDNRTEFLNLYGLNPNQALRHEFDISETNAALYATSTFAVELGGRTLDGEVGVRYVDVTTDTTFYDQVSGESTSGSTETSELLKNLTLRYHITDDLLARFTYGQTLRMPAFNDLNPTITYFDDVTNIGYGTANGGNANLKPTTSDNIDLSLEWYFGNASAAYVTLFERKIDGLVIPFRNRVERDIEGFTADTFILSQPDNASNGKLTGTEIGVNYFPENLPGYLDGLGVQVSYTALESEQTIPILNSAGEVVDTDQISMFGVSDSSYSVSFAYERDTFDARLSYVWRDDFLNNNEAPLFANPLGVYRDAEKSLAMQVSYDVLDNLTLTFDGTNLTNELYQSRYGASELHTFGSSLYSRTFAIGARYTF